MSSIFSPLHERLLRSFRVQLSQHPQVKVVLNTPVTPELVRQVRPDAVVVAIGGDPKGIDVPGADGKNVVTSHDFLEMLNGHPPKKAGLINKIMWNCGAVFLRLYYTPTFARVLSKRSPWPLGNPLAIIGGGLPGCELGHLSMESGRTTTIVEGGPKIGYDVGGSDRFHVVSAFRKAENVTTLTSAEITEITPKTVEVMQHSASGDQAVSVPAKTVAVTLGFQSNRGLFDALQSTGVEVYEAGDCADPGRIADATKAGYLAACRI
jgi:2,4-dienoyl-CoA reductase (NADPH2)